MSQIAQQKVYLLNQVIKQTTSIETRSGQYVIIVVPIFIDLVMKITTPMGEHLPVIKHDFSYLLW